MQSITQSALQIFAFFITLRCLLCLGEGYYLYIRSYIRILAQYTHERMNFCDGIHKGEICSGSDEFQMPGIIAIVLDHEDTCDYITYEVPTELHKTREWSPTPLSKCIDANSGSRQKGDLGYQHKYEIICSEYLHTPYIHTC